jgi:hypothetical protein
MAAPRKEAGAACQKHPLGTPCGAAQPGTTRNGPDIISVREKTEDQCKAKKLVTQLMVTITCIRLCGEKIRAATMRTLQFL